MIDKNTQYFIKYCVFLSFVNIYFRIFFLSDTINFIVVFLSALLSYDPNGFSSFFNDFVSNVFLYCDMRSETYDLFIFSIIFFVI